MAKGKFEYWLTDDGLLTIQGWARDGLNDEQIAKNMGIAVQTYYRWQDRFSSIQEAIKKGKAPVDIIVENALFKRACGYEYDEVITEMSGDGKKHIKKVTRHVPPDTAAAIFWLKNRKPPQWRDKPVADNQVDSDEFNKLLKAIDSAAKNGDKESNDEAE